LRYLRKNAQYARTSDLEEHDLLPDVFVLFLLRHPSSDREAICLAFPVEFRRCVTWDKMADKGQTQLDSAARAATYNMALQVRLDPVVGQEMRAAMRHPFLNITYYYSA